MKDKIEELKRVMKILYLVIESGIAKNINEIVSSVMASYCEEIEKLRKENLRLLEERDLQNSSYADALEEIGKLREALVKATRDTDRRCDFCSYKEKVAEGWTLTN